MSFYSWTFPDDETNDGSCHSHENKNYRINCVNSTNCPGVDSSIHFQEELINTSCFWAKFLARYLAYYS